MTPRLVVAVLLACAGCGRSTPITEETRARERFVRDLLAREGLADGWSLASRSTIQFEDGLGRVEEIDPAIPAASWREAPHACVSMPSKFVRYIGPRAHLRVRADGTAAMHLVIHGHADLGQLHTRPLVTASLDGVEFHGALVEPDGHFRIEATIPRDRLRDDWSDIYVMLSSVHEPWRDPMGAAGVKLTVARFEHVSWEPVAP